MPPSNGFNISLENEKRLKIEEAEFIFAQAEKQLLQSVSISEKIVTRTTILLTVCVGVLCSLLGFCYSSYNDNYESINIEASSSFIMCLYISAIFIYISKNIRGAEYKDIGSEPKALLNDYYFSTHPEEKERTLYNYIYEIKDYQDRIESNKATNTRRWEIFHKSLKAVIYMPIIYFSILIIAYWVSLVL